ncbi:MAG: GTP cyclohydrolase [Candidatus Tectomicrobia bacterium]|uniref:GTP cyclohydrolase n=1 Tax=Tectimicrobiota bacterium TaxID=2528274 RepID=A0A937W0I9_UNCTE|nr:GTP cyclohydrolase [Candidatus Tectomicrobia bacterium]
MVVRLAEGPLQTRFGTFTELLYYDGQRECLAIVMGDVRGRDHVLCRVHSHCVSAHLFNSLECDCREQMEIAQAMIEQEGAGVIIWLDQDGRGHGHMALLRSRALQAQGLSQTEAYIQLGYTADARHYTSAAAILQELGVASVLLLTNSPNKIQHLRQAGIHIAATRPVALDRDVHTHLHRFYDDKIAQGHHIPTQHPA